MPLASAKTISMAGVREIPANQLCDVRLQIASPALGPDATSARYYVMENTIQ
jgi:hypothetical protein